MNVTESLQAWLECYTAVLEGIGAPLTQQADHESWSTTEMDEPTQRWSIEDLGDAVSRPDRFAGGGAVAAMSLVGAAATAELVFELSLRRRDLSDQDRQQLGDAVELARQLRNRFLDAIDQDIESLTELMEAQRFLRRARKSDEGNGLATETDRMRLAVSAAISGPLEAAADGTKLLQRISELRDFARPFTASDLGAAAATIQGAVTSLLLMAEVNLGLLDDPTEANRHQDEISERMRTSNELASSIIDGTRSVIQNEINRDN